MVGMAKSNKASEKKNPAKSGALGISIDPAIREAIDAYIADYNAKNIHRATLTSTTEAAFKMFLAEQGFWPLKQTNATGT